MATISILVAPIDRLRGGPYGHVTIAVGTSKGTTYAGFGPNEAAGKLPGPLAKGYAQGQFDVEFVPRARVQRPAGMVMKILSATSRIQVSRFRCR